MLAMLAGKTRPTNGDASVGGRNAVDSVACAHASLGYCPQQDALFEELSAREHLTLYARLKVQEYKLCKRCVQWAVMPPRPVVP